MTYDEGEVAPQVVDTRRCPARSASSMNPAIETFMPRIRSGSPGPVVSSGHGPPASKSARVASEGAKVLVSC